MQTPMTPCHLIPMGHEWNASTNDVIVTWFALFANLVTSCQACTLHMCMHGACALIKDGVP